MEEEKLEIKIEEVKKEDKNTEEKKDDQVKIDVDKIEELSDSDSLIEELSIEKNEEVDEEDKKDDDTKEVIENKEVLKPEENIDNKSSLKLVLIITVISIIIIIILVVSFSVFFSSDKKTVVKNKNGASFELNYTDKNNILSIENAQPVADYIAINDLTGDNFFDFSVKTEIESANKISYIVVVEKNSKKCTILDKDIKVYLEKEESGSYETVFGPEVFEMSNALGKYKMPKGGMVLYTENSNKDSTDNYRLKIWLSETAVESVGKNYSLKVKIYGYSE